MKRNLKTFILFCIMLMGIQFAEIQAEAAITSIAEGSYTLKNVGTGKYLNVYGNKNANNTNIDVYSKDNTNGQDFKIYKYGEFYALNPLCSSTGRVVNVYAENAKSGNNVCLWDRTNHSTQLWKFDKVDGGYVIWSANNTSCVLNATGSKNNANVNITTYKSGNKNQIWVLESPATTTNPATSTLKIESVSKPETITQGNAFSIKGTVSSNYTLNSVMGQILKSDGKTVVYEKTVNPNAKTYNLYNSSVDTALLFNKLSVGTYYYKVFAKDVSGKSVVLVDSKFTVKSKTAATTQKPSTTEKATTEKATTEKATNDVASVVSNAEDTVTDTVKDLTYKSISELKIEEVATPSTIYVGTTYSIKGKITSNHKITKVIGEIIKQGESKAVYKKAVTPNKTSYNLYNGKIDSAMLFNKLSKGTYYYKITATDATGNELVLVNKEFRVTYPDLTWPTKSKTVNSKYGWRTYKIEGKKVRDYHRGIDIAVNGTKSNIYAAKDGTVVEAGWHDSYGRYVIISHGNKLWTLYAHCNKLLVKKEQKVKAGQTIAKSGNTGNSTGPHLHFEVRLQKNEYKKTIDPKKCSYTYK